jgi:hypothetical protein
MRNALVIAAREFEEKRFVAYAAVAFAILPFLLAVIPGLKANPADTIAMGSLVFGSAFAVAVGLISGASFIGRDLSDGRMSFYFSRPVGALSIWFGKLAAGILMIVGTFGFIIVPARLAAGVHWTRLVSASTTYPVFYILVIAIALFLIAHVIGTFARSRSPLIAVDLAAAVICGVVIRLLVLPLFGGEAFTLLKGLGSALGIAATIAIVAGGAWQLERGRTDRRRSHLALSQFLWGTMAVALLIAAAFVAWVVSAKVSDLTGNIHASRSTSGPFALITGTAKGRSDYRAAFLIDTEDGTTRRVDPWAQSGVHYTRDGRSATVPRRAGDVADIMIYTRGKAEPIDTGLTMTDGGYVISDDAGRIATIYSPNILSVYDVAQKRSLASLRLPDHTIERSFFVTPDVLRVYLNVRDGVRIAELDVRTGGLRDTGFIASPGFQFLYVDPAAEHIVVRRLRGELTLNDARTGVPIRTLATAPDVKAARYLRDGRVAFIAGPDSATVLHILSAAGEPQRDIPLGARKSAMFMGDDGARVVLTDVDASGTRMLEAINIDRGVVERRELIADWVPPGPMEFRPAIQPLREVFYADANHHIIAWNPVTGGKRAITGG